MTTETIQTIYTLISHAEGKCSGCLNVTYEAGDDQIKIFCNQCGAIPAAQPAPSANIRDLVSNFIRDNGWEDLDEGFSERLNEFAEQLAAQPAPGWISVSDAMPEYSEDGPEFVLVCWKEGWRGRKLSGNKDDTSVASPSGFDSCFIPYFLARHFHQATHWQYLALPAPPEPAKEPK